MIRNPFDALISEFNRENSAKNANGMPKNHTGQAPISKFSGYKWNGYVEQKIQRWELFYTSYAENYDPEQLHLLKYENLKKDLVTELRSLMVFLGIEMNTSVEKCVLKSKEGSNKRPKSKIDLTQFYRKVLHIILL